MGKAYSVRVAAVSSGFDVESYWALLFRKEGAVFNPLVEGGVWDKDTTVRRHRRGSTFANGLAKVHDYCEGFLPILDDIARVKGWKDFEARDEGAFAEIAAKG